MFITKDKFRGLKKNINPQRALVIVLPGIGDTLLATPIIRSLKASYPDISVDILVRECSEEMLRSNPLVSRTFTYSQQNVIWGYLGPIARIFRRYDLAISTKSSDRCSVLAFFAAPLRASVVPALRLKDFWKRVTNQVFVEESSDRHTLLQNLRLAEALKLEREYDVILPDVGDSAQKLKQHLPADWQEKPYAVVHLIPGPVHKWWPLKQWETLIHALLDKGLRVVLTGSPADRVHLEEMLSKFPDMVYSLASKASIADVSYLIKNAEVYLGPDTSTTHIAAATGVKTVAIFGPIKPSTWGPWPKGFRNQNSPFDDRPGIQNQSNVYVIRAACRCENFSRSCHQHEAAESLCLQELKALQVLKLLEDILPNRFEGKNSALQ